MTWLAIIFSILLSSCSYLPNYSPKVKARVEFESQIASIYGSDNARLIVKYDMFGLDGKKCIISSFYIDPFDEHVPYSRYVSRLHNAYSYFASMDEAEKEAIFYSKLKFLANRYNKVASSLYLTPKFYRPQKRSLNLMLKSLRNLNTKFKSVPTIIPTAQPIISSRYGMRKHPIDGVMKFHHGIDLVSGSNNLKILAASDGKVVAVNKSKGYGLSVIIKHENNISTKYAHLSKVFVKNGRKVNAGQVIGIMGNSGKSTNTHLHYEVIYKDRTLEPSYYLGLPNCIK